MLHIKTLLGYVEWGNTPVCLMCSEPIQWGLISLAVVLGILGIAGFMVIRRRKVTA